jgi:hypothetical protein
MASKINQTLTTSPQPEPWKAPSQATPYNIQLSASETPGRTHVEELRQESAEKASELLMLNHAKYHTLFDEVGFHSKLASVSKMGQTRQHMDKLKWWYAEHL